MVAFMMSVTYRIMNILPLLLMVCLLPSSSHASGEFYTVQAGTYAHNALSFAGRQFTELARKLDEGDRKYLRIEVGSRYFIIRVGRFENMIEAQNALKRVKTLVPDAFILEERDYDNSDVLIVYGNENEASSVRGESGNRKAIEKAVIDRDETTGDVPPLPGDSTQGTKEVTVLDIPAGSVFEETDSEREEEVIDRFIDDISSYYHNQEYGKAAELIREGIAQWPDNPDLHAWYGATLLDMQFPEKAYEQYRKAVELSPDVPEFHAGAGYSLLDIYIDRAKQSIDSFEKALEIDPDNIYALEGLGIVYVSIDKKDLAREIYDHLKELDEDAAARLNDFITWGLDWGRE